MALLVALASIFTFPAPLGFGSQEIKEGLGCVRAGAVRSHIRVLTRNVVWLWLCVVYIVRF